MAEQSFTGTINTNGEFEELATLANVTFSNDITYTINIGGVAQIKVSDAIFPVNNERFYYTPSSGSSSLYIMNTLNPLSVTIYGEG